MLAGHAMAMNESTKMPDGTDSAKKGEKHADNTCRGRKLLVHSECPSEMRWYYKAPKAKDPIEIAVANYAPGLVMACMYNVNSIFGGHRIIPHQSRGNKHW